MPQRIYFLDKGVVAIRELELPETVPADSVRIRATNSLISTGTEGICLHRLFAPGTHWDGWVKYPFGTGYSLVGEVESVGSDVSGYQIGQRVAARSNHGTHADAKPINMVPIPDGVSNEEAAWFALAKIGFMGWKASAQGLGDEVLIIGAGPIGQMATRWAVSAGARRVVVLDTVPMRLNLALEGGATGVLEIPVEGAAEAVQSAFDGKLPAIVIDTTGHAAVFAASLPLVADGGRFVVLGDTGDPSQQRLTPDVIRRGLNIVGAHDSHEDAQWNLASIVDLFFELVRRGSFRLGGLTSHTFRGEQCVEAYALLTERRAETMGVQFNWA